MRRTHSGTNLFLLIGLVVMGVSILAAAGVFGYQKYLEGVRDARAAELTEAQKNADSNTVDQFVRLRNRLLAANTLLSQHVALSQFFDVLEGLSLQNVRFESLKLTVGDDRTARIQMTGTARTFNALAAQSSAFAAEKRVKRAIFSGITINKDNTVAFTLQADLDPRLVVMGSAPQVSALAPAPSATASSTVPQLPATLATTTPVKAASTSPLAP